MIRNYFLVAYRSLLKNSGFTFINVVGLALGMAAFLFIVHYVRYEHSYEDFHAKADNIHRITLDIYNGAEYVVTDCETHAPMGPLLKREMPEVHDFTRFYSIDGKMELKAGATKIFAEKLYFADPSCIDVFTINLEHGDTTNLLVEPFTAVINTSLAVNLFGKEDAVGETFEINKRTFEVKGVMKNVPSNTHLKMNLLLSHATLPKVRDNYTDENWSGNNEFTYLLLAPETNLEEFNKKLTDKSIALKEKMGDARYVAEPIKTIHLYSNKTYEPEANGNGKVVSFLAVIAAFIILIAWVNYINLSTARAVERAREVGIRKVMGSMRVQLIIQFLSESVLINLIAGALAAVLFEIGLPFFQTLTAQPLSTHFIHDATYWYIFAVLMSVGTFSSGIYPAFVLSSFRPAAVLKGNFHSSSHGRLLRKTLVVFQFAVTVILMIGVSTVYLQIRHLQSVDLGMNVDQTVAIRAPANEGNDSLYVVGLDKLKSDMASVSQVVSVMRTSTLPGEGYDQLSSTMFTQLGQEQTANKYEYYFHNVDHDFFGALNIRFVAGRNYEADQPNHDQIVINQTAAERLGFASPEEAIGRKVEFYTRWPGEPATVIGVVADYYQRSPKENFIPMVFPYSRWTDYVAVKINTQNVETTIAELKNAFAINFPNSTFDYFFVDEMYNQLYQAETRFGQVIITFSLFATIIACLGLFGLSSYTVLQRTKEIGIRKVLGASVMQIVSLLTGTFVRVVLIAAVLALPAAYWVISEWLSNYAIRIDLNVWLFVVPVLLIVLVAIATVSVQTFRSAISNPVDSLKQE